MTQIDGKFLVHAYELTGCVINLLQESSGEFVCVDFFDVAGASTCATDEFASAKPTRSPARP